MGYAILHQAGGGGILSEDVTAARENVLQGKTTITNDSGDEVAGGTMPNNGTVNHTLPINGSFTIAKGFHSGSGKVSQNVATKGAETFYPGTSDQVIKSGRYLQGDQTIKKVTQSNLAPSNILNETVVAINNGDKDVWKVTGTRVTPVRNTYVTAIKGFGVDQNILSAEDSYTMPRGNGVCYFGMAMVGYGSTPKCKAEFLVNEVVKWVAELTGEYSGYAYKYDWWISENNLKKNDVIKIRCTITQGTHVFCACGAHMAC